MSKTKVLGVRLDINDLAKLERIAQSRGLKPSELVRQTIIQFIDQANVETQSENETVNAILNKTIGSMERIINYVAKYCEEFANAVASNNPGEDYNYWLNTCIRNKRGMTLEKLLELIRNADQELSKIMADYTKRSAYIKRLYQAVDQLMTRLS